MQDLISVVEGSVTMLACCLFIQQSIVPLSGEAFNDEMLEYRCGSLSKMTCAVCPSVLL